MASDHPFIAPSAADAGGAGGASSWTRQAREIVDGLHQRSALLYWTDLLLSAGAAWTLAALFFRAGTFIHEIVHFRDGELKWFARGWNLPLASAPRPETIRYLLQVTVLPLMITLRFAVLGPLSWLNRRLREWLLTGRNSAGVSNPYYRVGLRYHALHHLFPSGPSRPWRCSGPAARVPDSGAEPHPCASRPVPCARVLRLTIPVPQPGGTVRVTVITKATPRP